MTDPANPYYLTPRPLGPNDERLWATLVHLGGLLFGFLPAVIGFAVLKDRGPFVRAHTATALNFQITAQIAYVVGWIMSIFFVGLFLLFAVWVLVVVYSIIAAVAANSGQYYRYPLAIKFLN